MQEFINLSIWDGSDGGRKIFVVLVKHLPEGGLDLLEKYCHSVNEATRFLPANEETDDAIDEDFRRKDEYLSKLLAMKCLCSSQDQPYRVWKPDTSMNLRFCGDFSCDATEGRM